MAPRGHAAAPQFEDAQIALVVNADPALPVNADPDRITQVLTNVLGNALLATPAGGTVSVTARPTARGGEVVVTDTGVGLSGPDVERVFERFSRAPGQPRRSAGSGIGLTIARGIARGHGGEVTASSAGAGQGASSTLVLPLRTPNRSGVGELVGPRESPDSVGSQIDHRPRSTGITVAIGTSGRSWRWSAGQTRRDVPLLRSRLQSGL